MTWPMAAVVCVAIITITPMVGEAISRIFRDRKVLLPADKASRSDLKLLENHVRELDRGLTQILLANPSILESLPKEGLLRRNLSKEPRA